MNAGEIIKNTDALASEEVINGTPEITEDNLFELVDEGKLTIKDANRWIAEQSASVDTVVEDDTAGNGSGGHSEGEASAAGKGLSQSEGDDNSLNESGVSSGGAEPYKVYQTKEDFQRDFDRAWGQRYGKQKESSEKRDREYQALLNELGELLGVAPEAAADELHRRKLTKTAQDEGKNPEDYIERDRLLAENKRLMDAEKKRNAENAVAQINLQGAEITKRDPSFDIREAMRNPDFCRQVFFSRQHDPDNAVEIAYKIYYGNKSQSQGAPVKSQAQAQGVSRPMEGAASSTSTGEKKPVDFSKLSSAQIRELDKKIMRGERVEL